MKNAAVFLYQAVTFFFLYSNVVSTDQKTYLLIQSDADPNLIPAKVKEELEVRVRVRARA